MNYTTNQSDFVRNCFQAVLSDGKPHRYREILEYTRQQALGTEFEGKIEANNMVQSFGLLLGRPESEYERVRHGIYQKCAPEAVVQSTAISEMDGIYGVLDAACALQEQMKAAFDQICEKLPIAQDVLRQDYQFAFERLDQSIDGISGWLARMEDIADGMAELSDTDIALSKDSISSEYTMEMTM